MSLLRAAVICFSISLLLSACGQSGGLYLPKHPPPINQSDTLTQDTQA